MVQQSLLFKAGLLVGVLVLAGSVPSPLLAQTQTLSVSIAPGAAANKSVSQPIAKITVRGGTPGQKVTPFSGIQLVWEIKDSVLSDDDIAKELYYTSITHDGATVPVHASFPKVAKVGDGLYKVHYITNSSVTYTVSASGEHAYLVHYRPKELLPGSAVSVHLLNGGVPVPGAYTHTVDTTTASQLRTVDGLQVVYPTDGLKASVSVVLGDAYVAARNGIRTAYGISILDNGRSRLEAVQLVRNVLDSIGIALLPKSLTGLRINQGYTDTGTDLTGSIGIVPYEGSNPSGFATVLIHELHHQIDTHAKRCLERNASVCKYLTSAGALTSDGQILADLAERAKRIVAAAGTVAQNYIRTEVTTRVYKGTGIVSTTPTDPLRWTATLTPIDRGNAVYITRPVLRLTSGNLVGQEVIAGMSRGTALTIQRPGALPSAGSTFTLNGDGSDFFTLFPQEFIASISNEWNVDSRSEWSQCLAAYQAGRPIVMDQCLLFADFHSFKRDKVTMSKQRIDTGVLITSYVPAIKEHNRVVAIPTLGPQKFSFDGNGLVTPIGDLTGDRKVSLSDLLPLLRAAANASDSTLVLAAADVNCSGKVTVSDALVGLKVATGGLPNPVRCASTKTASVPQIAIAKVGTGKGAIEPLTITSVGAEIALGFKAVPAAGSRFAGWAGACTSSNVECRFTTSGLTALSATARFERTALGAALGFLGYADPRSLSTILLILSEIVFFAGFGVNYFRPSHVGTVVTALAALSTAILLFLNGFIG